jgi:hypothetical protein
MPATVTKDNMKKMVSNGLSISLIILLSLDDVFDNSGNSANDAYAEETKP